MLYSEMNGIVVVLMALVEAVRFGDCAINWCVGGSEALPTLGIKILTLESWHGG